MQAQAMGFGSIRNQVSVPSQRTGIMYLGFELRL